jgi:pimeloyl-ACP methyl ester carboxylesterase
VLLLAVGAAACGSGGNDGVKASGDSTTTAPTTTTLKTPITFYKPNGVLTTGNPGDVLAQEQVALDPSLPGTGYRITYVSTTPAGDRVPVTGMILVPPTPAPEGGYDVVAWSHGTTGIGDKCAPSKFIPFKLSGAAPLLSAGKLIAATDYEGLGTDTEIHPYLVSDAEAHNVLDSARAAKAFGGGNRLVTWGWSQGGQAALSARQVQQTYAPEFTLLGTAANAPVTDLATFLLPGRTDINVFPFTAEAILSWAEVYEQANLTDLVNVADAEKARLAQQACTGDIAANVSKPLDQIFRSDPQNLDTWREIAELNSVKVDGSDAPVFVTHGDADTIVPISGTEKLVAALCAQGVPTEFVRMAQWDHSTAFFLSLSQVDQWILDRFAGLPAPSNCPDTSGTSTTT